MRVAPAGGTPRAWSHRGRRTALDAGLPDEKGAILILAVVFLGAILTVTAILFLYAQTDTRSFSEYRTDRDIHYAADGALQQAVVMIEQNSNLGVTGSTGCTLPQVPIDPPALNYNLPSTVKYGVTSGSYLNVTCNATPGVQSGGLDPDGGQHARDVTIDVTCTQTGPVSTAGPVTCGGSGTARGRFSGTVASARVLFEPNYADVGPSATQRATIPKVVVWNIQRS